MHNLCVCARVTPAMTPFSCRCTRQPVLPNCQWFPWDETQRATFVRSQHLAQLDHYRKQCPEASYQIIEFRGRPIGRLFVDRRSTEIRILDITLLPEHCGQSIGTPIIRELMAEASRSGRSLSIYLDSFGPGSRSHSVFSRLGFKPQNHPNFTPCSSGTAIGPDSSLMPFVLDIDSALSLSACASSCPNHRRAATRWSPLSKTRNSVGWQYPAPNLRSPKERVGISRLLCRKLFVKSFLLTG
jgi:hypothetical protein